MTARCDAHAVTGTGAWLAGDTSQTPTLYSLRCELAESHAGPHVAAEFVWDGTP